jgi:hypothetical protein
LSNGPLYPNTTTKFTKATATLTVDTGTDVFTSAVDHGKLTGEATHIIPSGAGVLPAPLVNGTTYYVRTLTATTFTLHTTAAGAVADTGKVDITTAGTAPFFLTTVGLNRGTKVRNDIYERPFVTGKRVSRAPAGFVHEFQGQLKTPVLTVDPNGTTTTTGHVVDPDRITKTAGSFILRGASGQRFRLQETPGTTVIEFGASGSSAYPTKVFGGASGGIIKGLSGTGTPNGVVSAGFGQDYTDISTGNYWLKKTASGNTGWQNTTTL